MLFLHLTRFVLIALCVTHFTTLDFKAQAQTGSSLLPTSSQQRIAESKITDASIRADVEFLADDLLEGRGPGTRGDRLAQKYIISQFKQMGLKPAGNDGQWTQEVPLMGVTTRPPSTLTYCFTSRPLTCGKHTTPQVPGQGEKRRDKTGSIPDEHTHKLSNEVN